MRILDPACGSGSFLLGAYQYLLDYHLDWYLAHPTQRARKEIREVAGGEWRLTTEEKKRILLNHIYGVDIDPQAVEVTKLSLLLKVLEGETQETIGQQMSLWQERALPDLANNIKCGNSLIGTDFYEQATMLTEEEAYRINPFDWESEFPEAMGAGGFDAVIGNPPYIDSEWMTAYLPTWRSYCSTRYQTASGNWDVFCVFVEKALALVRRQGLSSLIVPNKLGSAGYAAGARRVLTQENCLVSIRDYSHVRVFPVSVYPIVYVCRRSGIGRADSVLYERIQGNGPRDFESELCTQLDYARYFGEPERPWQIFSDVTDLNPTDRLRLDYTTLDSVAEVSGAATVSEAYEMQELLAEHTQGRTGHFIVSNSGTIDRYRALWGEKTLRYLGDKYLRPVVPCERVRLLPPRRRTQAQTPKVIVAGMTKVLECIVDLNGDTLAAKSTSIVLSSMNLCYLLGLLNSHLLTFFFQTVFGGMSLQGGYLRIGPPQLKQLPIRTIDFSDPVDVARHDRMVELVERMLALHKDVQAAKTPNRQTMLQRQIEATDRQIDGLVYDLYDLTDEEIAIVEGA